MIPFPPASRRNLLALFAGLAAAPALADPAPGLDAEQKALAVSAQTYLQDLRAASGAFEQIDARGGIATGRWWIERPGRLRFAYETPNPSVVVSDGRFIGRYDARLNTVQTFPLMFSPLGLFLAKKIRWDQGVRITGVRKIDGGFEVAAQDGQGKVEGGVDLVFTDNPLRLAGWTVTDKQGRRTQIRLLSFERADGFPKDLFSIDKLKAPVADASAEP